MYISCGHTTDFYLGKTDLPRANSSKIWEGHTTDIGSQRFHASSVVIRVLGQGPGEWKNPIQILVISGTEDPMKLDGIL